MRNFLVAFLVALIPLAAGAEAPGGATGPTFLGARERLVRCLVGRHEFAEARQLIETPEPADRAEVSRLAEDFARRAGECAVAQEARADDAATPPAPGGVEPVVLDADAQVDLLRDLLQSGSLGAGGIGNPQILRHPATATGYVDALPANCENAGNCFAIRNDICLPDGRGGCRTGVLHTRINGVEVRPVLAGRPLVALVADSRVIPAQPAGSTMYVFTPPGDLTVELSFCEFTGDALRGGRGSAFALRGVTVESAAEGTVQCTYRGRVRWHRGSGRTFVVDRFDVPFTQTL